MRGRRNTSGAAMSPETIYARGKSAQWLGRLVEQGVELDSSFFECLGWSIGGLPPFARLLDGAIKTLPTKPSAVAARKAVRSALRGPEHCLDSELAECFEEHPSLRGTMKQLI